jgi:hypothetical protein
MSYDRTHWALEADHDAIREALNIMSGLGGWGSHGIHSDGDGWDGAGDEAGWQARLEVYDDLEAALVEYCEVSDGNAAPDGGWARGEEAGLAATREALAAVVAIVERAEDRRHELREAIVAARRAEREE